MGTSTRALSVAAAAVAILAAACGAASQGTETVNVSQPPTTPAEEGGSRSPVGSDDPAGGPAALVARTGDDLPVHPEPGAEPSHTLPATTGFGSPRALLVLDDRDGWLQVSLPERPNGSSGWIRRDQVDLREVTTSIEIDLEARTLTLSDGGDVIATTTVAVGTPENPTPSGDFYVVDKLATEDPDGAYGPFAFGLSAYSETLTEFGGGDGQVGIHGTDDPDSIGRDVSHGCVRVPNEVARELADRLPLGTPVSIR